MTNTQDDPFADETTEQRAARLSRKRREAKAKDEAASYFPPNLNGRFPVCKNAIGTHLCERCGLPTNIPVVNRPPCPAVPPEQRWGDDWMGGVK